MLSMIGPRTNPRTTGGIVINSGGVPVISNPNLTIGGLDYTINDATGADGFMTNQAGRVTFTVTANGVNTFDRRFLVNTVNGSAVGSFQAQTGDFTPLFNQLVVIPAGNNRALIDVVLKADMFNEGAETFSLVLSNLEVLDSTLNNFVPDTDSTIRDSTGIGTITDPNIR